MGLVFWWCLFRPVCQLLGEGVGAGFVEGEGVEGDGILWLGVL